MKKLVKVVAIVFGILVVLVMAAAVIVPLVVNPNDYKDRIVAVVEKQTGRQLKIQGDIDVSLFPWLGVKIEAVELGNAAGFENPLDKGGERIIRIMGAAGGLGPFYW
jgi:AsmA protein